MSPKEKIKALEKILDRMVKSKNPWIHFFKIKLMPFFFENKITVIYFIDENVSLQEKKEIQDLTYNLYSMLGIDDKHYLNVEFKPA